MFFGCVTDHNEGFIRNLTTFILLERLQLGDGSETAQIIQDFLIN